MKAAQSNNRERKQKSRAAKSRGYRVRPLGASAPLAQDVIRIPIVSNFDDIFPPTASALKARRKGVAFHEAGHCFAAYHFGFSLRPIAAELLKGPVFGLTHFYGEGIPFDGSSQARSRVEEAIVVLLGGASAVRKLRQRFESGFHLTDGDYEEARRLIEILTPPTNDPDLGWHTDWWRSPYPYDTTERQQYLRVMEYRAERLVSENWKAVESLASQLLRSGSLTAKQVKQIVARAQN